MMTDSATSPTRSTGQVFFDPSGRRWRYAKFWFLAIPAIVAALTAVSWQPAQTPPAWRGTASPPALPDLATVDEAPFIGVGPLLRLVRIVHRGRLAVAVDPLTGQDVATLSSAERGDADGSRFAIYRYGYDQGAHKTISLTFDDGPSPTWTPKILDLLSQYHVPATFFVIGEEVVRHPDLVKRELREGHAVGNHTFTHPELTLTTVKRELVTTDRILAATGGLRTGLARFPYDGYGPSGRDVQGELLLQAERLGYVVSVEDFDTNDWKYGDKQTRPATPIPLPPTSMDNITVLLHDGGGDRSATIDYLRRLIGWARSHGYTFHSLPQVSQVVAARSHRQHPNLWDRATLWDFQLRWILPARLLRLLFWTAVISVLLSSFGNTVLAAGARMRRRPAARPRGPTVTAVVAAYNEEAVIGRCLQALMRSRGDRLREIVVIDDGSTDRTADIVAAAARGDARIRLIRQPNQGKAVALNRGFERARSEVVVTLDADTLLDPDAVGYFSDSFGADRSGRLGAAAGVVRVGNVGNLVTRWQALEYLIQTAVDRAAQHALRAIMIVPGACAAWRRSAVLAAGGYSSETLAEDCDLALELQKHGYRVIQEDRAWSSTEAPETFRDLRRQRFRWTFGSVQALWKHRGMMLNVRYRWLGLFVLPIAALGVMMPLVFLPFVYAVTAIAAVGHDTGTLLQYGTIILLLQTTQAVAAIALSRQTPRHLLVVPIYRLIAEPLRAYLLYKSALVMLRGTRSRWHKVRRTASIPIREPAKAEVRL